MNLERFHSILSLLVADLGDSDVIKTLSELAAVLERLGNSPLDPTEQIRFQEIQATLYGKLASSATNRLPPGWIEALKAFDVYKFTGDRLRQEVESILARNAGAHAAAREEIRRLIKELERILNSSTITTSLFEQFRIGNDRLDVGECEIGVLIPRPFVKSELGQLGEELKDLDRILAPFEEMAYGNRPGLTVRTISSSDYGVYILAGVPICASFGKAIEWLMSRYLQYLQIQKIRQDLKLAGMPEIADNVETTAKERLDSAADDVTQQIMTEFGKGLEADRANEIRNEVKNSVVQLSVRIKAGFQFELRAVPEKSRRDNPESMARDRCFQMIAESQKFLESAASGAPAVLSLPRTEDAPPAA